MQIALCFFQLPSHTDPRTKKGLQQTRGRGVGSEVRNICCTIMRTGVQVPASTQVRYPVHACTALGEGVRGRRSWDVFVSSLAKKM